MTKTVLFCLFCLNCTVDPGMNVPWMWPTINCPTTINWTGFGVWYLTFSQLKKQSHSLVQHDFCSLLLSVSKSAQRQKNLWQLHAEQVHQQLVSVKWFMSNISADLPLSSGKHLSHKKKKSVLTTCVKTNLHQSWVFYPKIQASASQSQWFYLYPVRDFLWLVQFPCTNSPKEMLS